MFVPQLIATPARICGSFGDFAALFGAKLFASRFASKSPQVDRVWILLMTSALLR
jgi:hypothetical protein